MKKALELSMREKYHEDSGGGWVGSGGSRAGRNEKTELQAFGLRRIHVKPMPNILICEDEHVVAMDIKRHLERFGYGVVGAFPSAEEAIEACGTLHPDLVLMDVQLQGELDGLEASRRIYTEFSIPVIILTAYADDTTVTRVKTSLPFGYIIKPFEDRELRTAIEIALNRHDMDQRLRLSEERYRSLFEEAPSANFTISLDGAVTACNSAFLRLFGYPEGDRLPEIRLDGLFASPEEGSRVIGELLGGTPSSIPEEWTLRRTTGGEAIVLATVSVAHGHDLKVKEYHGYLVDITERRELEVQLRQAQKMEAIGRLAGGIAHDFNNIITAIMGYCNLLAEDVADQPVLKEEVDGILSAAHRAVNLTRQLLAFSRKQPVEAKTIDANNALTDLEKMARRLVRENIALKLYLNAKHSMISIDPGQFEQVIVNLMVNAKDAIAGAGTIQIETSNIDSDGSGRHHGIAKGHWLRIALRDSGSGIAEEDLQRIFEPFFTTKAKDQGTGLGLSNVYAIVNRSGGRIAVESEPGRGTSFFIYVPLAEGIRKVSKDKAAPAPLIAQRSGTILLAEDDDYLRGLLTQLLTKIGYRVLEATNAGDAILIAEGEADFILFTDIVMPRMNGYELASRLCAARPELRVLFMSGYHDAADKIGDARFGRSAFIEKPFTHEQLLAALDDLTKY